MNQFEDYLIFVKSRTYEIPQDMVFMEQHSAFKKEERRKDYNKIKQLAHEGKIDAVIVWRLDRWVKQRDPLMEDINYLARRNVKLHSVKEDWLESINIEGLIGQEIKRFLFGLIGCLGEMESLTRSERMKAAIKKNKRGEYVSKKTGKRWGNKPKVSREQAQEIRRLHVTDQIGCHRLGNQFKLSSQTVWNVLKYHPPYDKI